VHQLEIKVMEYCFSEDWGTFIYKFNKMHLQSVCIHYYYTLQEETKYKQQHA